MKSINVSLVGILFCIAGTGIAVSLASYSTADPPELLGFPQPEILHNWLGLPGALIAAALLIPFGYAAYLMIIPLWVYGIRFLYRYDSPKQMFDQPVMQSTGFLLAAVGFAGLFSFMPDGLLKSPCPLIGPGGYSGTIFTTMLSFNIASAGIIVFLISMILAGFVLSSRQILPQLLFLLQQPQPAGAALQRIELTGLQPRPRLIKNEIKKDQDRLQTFLVQEQEVCMPNKKEAEEEYDESEIEEEYEEEECDESEIEGEYEEEYDEEENDEYAPPSPELLAPAEEVDEEQYNDTLHERAQLLEKVLLNFKITAKVVDIQKGPVITQYELRLEKGTRIKKIQQLQDDLGVELKTGSIRIVAPIPGKNTVGVELPNEHCQTVRLRDVMENSPNEIAQYALPLFLGKGVTGDPLVSDLIKMPHLLIAGQTGTGKSVCLNSIIVSMLMTRSPEEVRMLMIDPKQVEFCPYQRIPHLIHPVVDDMQKAAGALSWVVDQMEERYDLFKKAMVRNLAEFNKLSEDDLRRRMNMIDADEEEWEKIPQKLPYLVVIIDEVADLIQSAKEVEAYIIRLTQKSRAAGIHLILATQKPTREVFTSLIKTNLPARIAFRVSSKVDSMVILDRTGAEQLIGRGDMLISVNNEITRGQGAFVTDEEIEMINQCIGTDHPDFDEDLMMLDAEPEAEGIEEEVYDNKGKISRDELYYKAVDLVIQKGRGSVSMMQTCLGIGYPRASRMMDFMEEDGIVGKANGSKPRNVLVSANDWKKRHSGSPVRPVRRHVNIDFEEEDEDDFVAS